VDERQSLLADLISGDESRAERSASALIELGEDVIPALFDLTKSSNADSRWWALRALAQSPHSRTGHLIPFLEDSAPEVRQCAALGLAEKVDEAATQPLVRALSDGDAMVCTLAANALIKIGKPAVPFLIEAVKRRPATEGSVEGRVSQSARIHALRALAEIRDRRAIPVLMQVIEEDSALLGHWAKEGLERLGLDMVYLKPV
jgi:HEAT repeat protein